MRRISILAGAVLILAASVSAKAGGLADVTVGSTPAKAAAQPMTREDVNAWLDGLLPYALAKGDIAGAVVVVVKDGHVLTEKGYGYADVSRRIPVDPQRTLFRPGSISKLFTWTAAMQLVEQRKLDLDADVNSYLDFKIPPRGGRPITLRDLFTHTPGFEEDYKRLLTDDLRDPPSLEAYLKAWTPRRIFPPGAIPAYSNYGAALAAYIVQRVSGEPFDDYVEGHIFVPLGMNHSTFREPLPARFRDQMSNGYKLGSGPPWRFEMFAPAAAGGLSATGDDIARFMIAHLQDGRFGDARILGAATARSMHESERKLLPPLNSMVLGFYETDRNGQRIIAHGGDTQVFHSDLELFLDRGVGVFISLNSAGRDHAAADIRTALLDQFADRYFPAPGPVEPTAVTAVRDARVVSGLYESSRRSQTTITSLGNLLSQVHVRHDRAGQLTVETLNGLDGRPKVWREVGPFVWREVSGQERLAAKVTAGQVQFLGSDGRAPYQVFQPAPWWRSSDWLLPLAAGGLAILAAAAAAWPISAIVRRAHGVSFPLSGSAAAAHRLVRMAAILDLAYAAAWPATLQAGVSDLTLLSDRLDLWLWALEAAGLLVIAGEGVAIWNAWLAWAGPRPWWAKAWAAALAAAGLPLIWVAVVARLIGSGVNY